MPEIAAATAGAQRYDWLKVIAGVASLWSRNNAGSAPR
ncbi:hypothetical protein BN970_00786 [Mycolicibacterium conceptionense]|uniref:Uncharacterized protein n=1 Tax=Mycolicibacterium conceptionense TaxID=451644 RepID=A0A0U1CYI9_9MYCO|nr:hypothetical protein BN970_00786 [Mycolicibacterium conceptionense]